MANIKAMSLLLAFLVVAMLVSENALDVVSKGAQRLVKPRNATSFATSAVENAFVFHQAPLATKNFALATTTGRPREVDQSALNFIS
uniref:Uncharacterized protein n=1 Tax=Chenopodium quinoa TaxID=63459 RepID=A0A803M148_CHEQI